VQGAIIGHHYIDHQFIDDDIVGNHDNNGRLHHHHGWDHNVIVHEHDYDGPHDHIVAHKYNVNDRFVGINYHHTDVTVDEFHQYGLNDHDHGPK
jgi:hypothetical protein